MTNLEEHFIAAGEYLLKIKKAQNNLHEFVKLAHEELYDIPYIESEFSQTVCTHLEKTLEKILENKQAKKRLGRATGTRPKVQLYAPPRAGKSFILKCFVCYAFYKDPGLKIMGASYNMELASTVNQEIQTIMMSDFYVKHFYDAFTLKTVRNSEKFATKNLGQYVAAGVRGSLTGKGFNIGIIDDPYKEQPSKSEKEAVELWYDTVFSTRQSSDSAQVLIMTRWADDDLAQYLTDKGGWDIFKFPAINENGQPITENLGLDLLLEQKTHLPAARWSALYMQNPYAEGGNHIRSEFFNYFEQAPESGRLFMVADTAHSKTKYADYSVITVWRVLNGRYYLLDLWRKKVEYPQLKEKMKEMYSRWRPYTLYVERKASGLDIIPDLMEAGIPCRPLKALGTKYERISLILPKIESGLLYLPKGAYWLREFISECEAFRADEKHKNDDMVDCLAYALGPQCEGAKPLKVTENAVQLMRELSLRGI